MNFDALDISASALSAQRIRMDTIASNIANVNTTRNPDGTPGVYRRKEAVFASVYGNMVSNKKDNNEETPNDTNITGGDNNAKPADAKEDENISSANGVKILSVNEDYNTPLNRVYNPSHPDADKDGYVNLPNVNIVSEMVDMISANRAYEANVTSINATKSMIAAALRI